MVTIAVDLLAESFTRDVVDGEDATKFIEPIGGIKPDKLIVVKARGLGGDNPDCLATFEDERKARAWFAIVTEDADPDWFDENVVG